MKCYVYVYGVMILGGLALVIVLMFPAITLTFFSYKNRNKPA
jgi:hypothetical protein